MTARARKKTKLIIFGDSKRRFVAEAVRRFTEFARGKAEVLANCLERSCRKEVLRRVDFAVVFGGDGTILSAARDLAQTNVPVIGVNVGTLGYLAEFSIEELEQLFERIVADKSLISRRMVLQCCVQCANRRRYCSTAVNDVVITAGPPFSLVELRVTIQQQGLARCISDGLIICTPTGSTAYNLSAGGPILEAGISAIVVAALCPHSLSFRPIVISADHELTVHAVRANPGTTVLLDGDVLCSLKGGDVIKVRKDRGAFLVVNNPMRSQWDTLANKLNWAGKPKYNMQKGTSNEK
jgi:NAD+ kinase